MRGLLAVAVVLCAQSAQAVDYAQCRRLDQAESQLNTAEIQELRQLSISREAAREVQKCGAKPVTPSQLNAWYDCIYATGAYANATEKARYEDPIRTAYDKQRSNIYAQELKLNCP